MGAKSGSGAGHRWAFARIGGVDQVLLRDGSDIASIPELDQKLWAALAMPKKAAGVLQETLDALDSDADGRIRAPEISAAIRFCCDHLTSLDAFVTPGEALATSALKPGPLAEAAAWVLGGRGQASATEVTLDYVRGAVEQFAAQRFNGDGVLPAASAGDEGVAAVATEVMAAGYGAPDRSGSPGVTAEGLDAFAAEAKAWLAWAEASRADPAVLPLGDGTTAAWNALEAVRAKMDDWFLRSSLAAIAGPGSGAGAAWGQEQRLAALLAAGIRPDSPELLELPLAAPSADGALDLSGPLNPGWQGAVRAFASAAGPLLGAGATRLDRAAWERIKAALSPYGSWLAARPQGHAGSLGEARLTAILSGGQLARLRELIAEDAGWAGKREGLWALRRLLLLRRDLFTILRNFVNFGDFYGKGDAVFRAGALYIDGRECDLCLEVDNPAAHPTVTIMSGAYLVYCDCSRKDGRRKSIVAALTAGEAGNLFVGKNGVFYDRHGDDWDARVTKLQVQPISIREAFFSPYRWLARTIEDLVAKRAAAAEAESQAKLKGQAEGAVAAVAAPGKAEPKADLLPKKIDVGTVAAIGVALGSIGAMVTGILAAFVGMGAWMPVGVVSILVLISGPSMILAYLKLRRRNLGPILDAEGWAVNSRLRINVPFGGALTRLAALPPGSERRFQDPFAEKRRPWGLYLLLLAVIALAVLWAAGVLDAALPQEMRLRSLLGL